MKLNTPGEVRRAVAAINSKAETAERRTNKAVE